MYYNKCFLCRNLCWVWKEKHTILVLLLLNCLQELKTFKTDLLNIIFLWFLFMITRLQDQVQLSINFTRALFHEYFVAINYRWICIFLILSESAPLTLTFMFFLQTVIHPVVLMIDRLNWQVSINKHTLER